MNAIENYNYLDQRIHLLTQIIAKANRTLVPKQEDDSHTTLYFDAISNRIYGRWIKRAEDRIVLTLNLSTFEFQWINDSMEELSAVEIKGKDMNQLELTIEESLAELGLNTEGFRDALHFEINAYEFRDHPFSAFDPEHTITWKKVRSMANHACSSLLGYFQATSEVRIWPHHFDTGIYFEPNDKLGIGFGLAMNDSMVGSPYYYFSLYGLNGHEINYDQLASLTVGRWIVEEHWKGAVLPIDVSQQEAVYTFIKDLVE